MNDFDAWLKTLVSTLGSTDRALAEEIRAIHGSRSFAASGSRSLPASVRNIVLRVGRPVLAIVGNAPRLDFKDSESAVWRARLQASAPLLQRAAQAVGRIEVKGLPGFTFVGTGWLVDKNTVVTNRHVAQTFSERTGAGFTFKQASRTKPKRDACARQCAMSGSTCSGTGVRAGAVTSSHLTIFRSSTKIA